MSNMKPADELRWVREQIKTLQERESALKEGMTAGELDLVGDFTFVTISERASKRFDRKAAEAELGDLSRFDAVSTAKVVKVEAIHQPEEA